MTTGRAIALGTGLAIALAVGAPASAAPAPSPACQAVLKRIAYDNAEIAKANKSLRFPNRDPKLEATRRAQLNKRIADLNRDLAAAKPIKVKECGPDLAAYNGAYGATYLQFQLNFEVRDGKLTGDLVGTGALDPKTGRVMAKANFLGAECGAAEITFDAVAGTVRSGPLTCTMLGQERTAQLDGRRA